MNISPKVAQAASVLLQTMTPVQAAHDCKLTAQAAGFTTRDLERTRELCLKLARLESSDPERAAEWRQTVERIAKTGSALPASSPGDTVVCVDDSASFNRLREGATYTVTADYDDTPTVKVNGSSHSMERFRPVAEPPPTPVKPLAPFRSVTVECADGNKLHTQIRGTDEEIREHYLGRDGAGRVTDHGSPADGPEELTRFVRVIFLD